MRRRSKQAPPRKRRRAPPSRGRAATRWPQCRDASNNSPSWCEKSSRSMPVTKQQGKRRRSRRPRFRSCANTSRRISGGTKLPNWPRVPRNTIFTPSGAARGSESCSTVLMLRWGSMPRGQVTRRMDGASPGPCWTQDAAGIIPISITPTAIKRSSTCWIARRKPPSRFR